MRLREIASTLGITERTAFGVVADLTDAGYVLKERDGRRNRYEIQHHLPLVEPASEERTVGELLELLGGREITRSTAHARRPRRVRRRRPDVGYLERSHAPKGHPIVLPLDLTDSTLCNAIRRRPHGYQLRCLEPDGHDGGHRWNPELVGDPVPTPPRVTRP